MGPAHTALQRKELPFFGSPGRRKQGCAAAAAIQRTRWPPYATILLLISLCWPCTIGAPEVVSSGGGKANALEENDLNLTEAVADFKYGTNGPAKWYEHFKACGGNIQSPINIDTTASVRVHHPHLFWWNYNLKPRHMTLTNNGHTVVLSGEWVSHDQTPYYWHSTGSSDEENFILDHIHFHWGLHDDHGSEHLINNRGFPLELHAVHYSRAFTSIAEALTLNHGIRVISILFMVSDVRNAALDAIVDALPQVQKPSSISIEPFEIGKLLARFSKAFISYNGSLTTPPCAEAVTWVVRLAPATISRDQLAAFRKLEDHTGGLMAGNLRPVQPVNGRTIFHVT